MKKPKLIASLKRQQDKHQQQRRKKEPLNQRGNGVKGFSPQVTNSRTHNPHHIKFLFVKNVHDEPSICFESRVPFSPFSHILLLGEGNFSFSVALVGIIESFSDQSPQEDLNCCMPPQVIDESSVTETNFPSPSKRTTYKLVATTLETSRLSLLEKYPEAEKNLEMLEHNENATILYGVDGTNAKMFISLFKKYKPTRLVFNFPHLGGSIKDQHRNILAHQRFLSSFFTATLQASKVLPPPKSPTQTLKMRLSNGRALRVCELKEDHSTVEEFLTLITLKEGEPYDSWNVKEIAKENGFSCAFSLAFDRHLYPGYTHVNTIGNYSAYCSKKRGPGEQIHDRILDKDDNLKNKVARTFAFCVSNGRH